MEADKGQASDEDIPSDFFDDFNREDFMEGLSVVDIWNKGERSSKRRNSRRVSEAIESVEDLRELIQSVEEDEIRDPKPSFKTRITSQSSKERESSVKLGSRRDPNKTIEAIRKDKEVKVKEYLAKQLDSTNNLCPPGTELDDFFDVSSKDNKPDIIKSKQTSQFRTSRAKEKQEFNYDRQIVDKSKSRWISPHQYKRHSPNRSRRQRHFSPHHSQHHSPRRSPLRSQRRSPRYSPCRSPRRSPFRTPRRSPCRTPRRSPRRSSRRGASPYWSPQHRISPRHSPDNYSPSRWSSRQHSPRRIPRRLSRSPQRRSPSSRDRFLYPSESQHIRSSEWMTPKQSYTSSVIKNYSERHESTEYSYSNQQTLAYGYPQEPAYTSAYNAPCEYPVQMPMSSVNTVQGYVPAPIPVPGPVHVPDPITALPENPNIQITIPNNRTPIPAMVPAPNLVPPSSSSISPQAAERKTPYDALAQLVAEGKISKEDYLKLAPNKGTSNHLDTKTRVMVLNRCGTALSKLTTLMLPKRLLMNNNMVGNEPKSVLPKFCSPLKRQADVDFHFTKPVQGSSLKNKQIVDSIISSLQLQKEISRPKNKKMKNMKDASVQTTRPHCDVCEIREATKTYNVGTSTNPDYFSSTVHTQVVEQDLISSKVIFNPSGSVSDSAPISIAHLTPAQLVSQLAARAKTLKKTDMFPAYGRRNQQNNYEYDGRGGGGQYSNFGQY